MLQSPASALHCLDRTQLNFRTIKEANSAIAAGQVTAEALVTQALDTMTAHASLNAIAEVGAEQALATARKLDEQQAAGVPRGPLHGIPITVKDLFQVTGFATRAGTRAHRVEGWRWERRSTATPEPKIARADSRTCALGRRRGSESTRSAWSTSSVSRCRGFR